MSSTYFLLACSIVFYARSSAHYPVAVINDYPPLGIAALADSYPYLAVAPEPVVISPAPLPAPVVEAAPVVAPVPVVVPEPAVAPAPVVAAATVFPYAVYAHHHHPRIQVRNVVRSYIKETGRVEDTEKSEFPTLLDAAFQRKLFNAKKAAKASKQIKS